MVGVAGLEPTTSCSQSTHATNCTTPRFYTPSGIIDSNLVLLYPFRYNITDFRDKRFYHAFWVKDGTRTRKIPDSQSGESTNSSTITMCPKSMNSTECALLIHSFVYRLGRFVRVVGFEPTDDNAFVPSLVSKTSSFNHSLTP